MTKQRAEFLYQLKGTILSRTLNKASSQSKYAGQKFYRLRVKLEDHTKSLQVFRAKLTNPQIWTTLRKAKRGAFSGQQFIFHCRNQRGYFYLVDWEKLPEVQPEVKEEVT